MNLGIRAILYSARKWKKTLLVFFLLLAITTLVLSGLAIADAQEEQAEEVRGTTGASFTVERNLSTGGWASENGGSYSTQEFISEEMIQEIASVEGVADYDASTGCLPQLSNAAGESLSLESFSFYAYGSFNSQYNSLFVSGQLALVEGSHITENMTNGILLSRECVEKNGLQLGDTVIGKIWDPNYNNPEVEMELVGVFDLVADKEDEANMYDDSSLWDFTEYAFCSNDATTAMAAEYSDGGGIEDAFFYVTDAAKLNNIIADVQKISSINWNNYTITANDEVYQNISQRPFRYRHPDYHSHHCHYCCEHGTDYPDPLHVHPQPETGNRNPAGGGYCQACGDSPVCAGNPADRGGGLPAGLPLQ